MAHAYTTDMDSPPPDLRLVIGCAIAGVAIAFISGVAGGFEHTVAAARTHGTGPYWDVVFALNVEILAATGTAMYLWFMIKSWPTWFPLLIISLGVVITFGAQMDWCARGAATGRTPGLLDYIVAGLPTTISLLLIFGAHLAHQYATAAPPLNHPAAPLPEPGGESPAALPAATGAAAGVAAPLNHPASPLAAPVQHPLLHHPDSPEAAPAARTGSAESPPVQHPTDSSPRVRDSSPRVRAKAGTGESLSETERQHQLVSVADQILGMSVGEQAKYRKPDGSWGQNLIGPKGKWGLSGRQAGKVIGMLEVAGLSVEGGSEEVDRMGGEEGKGVDHTFASLSNRPSAADATSREGDTN